MNARRLILVTATAVLIMSFLTSYLGREETTAAAAHEKIAVAGTDPIPTAPDASPGEVRWASWHTSEPSVASEPAAPVFRDIQARERRYEDLPVAVRERLMRDYVGLDVALPRGDQ